MNNSFHIKRFGKLFSKELSERAPIILKFCAIVVLLPIALWITLLIFNNTTSISTSGRVMYLVTVTFISAVAAPFNLYKSYNHRKKGLDYVSLPASINEKFLSMTILSMIVMPLITFLSVVATDTLIHTITPSLFEGNIFSDSKLSVTLFNNGSDIVILPAICLFGNLLFRSNKGLKTLLTAATIYTVFIMIVAFIFLVLFKNQIEEINGLHIDMKINKLSDLTSNSLFDGYPGIKFTIILMSVVYNYIFPVGFMAAAYYRFKTLEY